mmetsp:Transcript_12945/g.33032  ORF Transcript_12945/g.33032 Transcript_12945/m.33032 type:complete len:240 (+) Transcript_12945:811-1530(+)
MMMPSKYEGAASANAPKFFSYCPLTVKRKCSPATAASWRTVSDTSFSSSSSMRPCFTPRVVFAGVLNSTTPGSGTCMPPPFLRCRLKKLMQPPTWSSSTCVTTSALKGERSNRVSRAGCVVGKLDASPMSTTRLNLPGTCNTTQSPFPPCTTYTWPAPPEEDAAVKLPSTIFLGLLGVNKTACGPVGLDPGLAPGLVPGLAPGLTPGSGFPRDKPAKTPERPPSSSLERYGASETVTLS